MNWSRYAEVYDLMADSNPAYQKLINEILERCMMHRLTTSSVVLDLGAGTGNLTVPLAKRLPDCEIVHVEPNGEMLGRAKEKARVANVDNIVFVQSTAEEYETGSSSVALIASVHAFYAFRNPLAVAESFADWLIPDGVVIACDFGRTMDTKDWSRYLLLSWLKSYGLIKTVNLALRSFTVKKSNQEIALKQADGQYWTHSLDEFSEIFIESGLTVLEKAVRYRDYSDLVICRKGYV